MEQDAPSPVIEQTFPREGLVAESESEDALRALYYQRPSTLRVGLIQSADGKCSGPDGSSRSLNGPADLRVLRVLRAAADVVLVGARTARRERYGPITLPYGLKVARNLINQPEQPTLAIVTFTGNLPLDTTKERTLVVTSSHAPAFSRLRDEWGDKLVVAGVEQISPRAVINELEQRGLTRILCEGGPTLARPFLDRGLVADYCLTTSDKPGGAQSPDVPKPPATMALAHAMRGDDMTMERWVTPF